MGFFSSLLRIASPIISGFLGGATTQALLPAPAAAAPAPITGSSTAPPAVIPSAKQTAAQQSAAARGRGLAFRGRRAAEARAEVAPREVDLVACPTNKNVIRTIVQTILPDGTVCKEEVLQGRPFLMRKDFVTAKRVRKLISKAKTKIIPTRREESEQTKLIKAVVTTATRNVLTGGSSHGGRDG